MKTVKIGDTIRLTRGCNVNDGQANKGADFTVSGEVKYTTKQVMCGEAQALVMRGAAEIVEPDDKGGKPGKAS